MHLQEKCLLFKSPNCFAIYDKIYNLSPRGPDGPCRCHIGRDDKYPPLPSSRPPSLCSAKWWPASRFVTSSAAAAAVQNNHRAQLLSCYTMFQIYYVTMWTISMDCEGCLVNISGSGVFPNSVRLHSVAPPPPPPLHCDQTKRSPTTVLGSIIFLSKFK